MAADTACLPGSTTVGPPPCYGVAANLVHVKSSNFANGSHFHGFVSPPYITSMSGPAATGAAGGLQFSNIANPTGASTAPNLGVQQQISFSHGATPAPCVVNGGANGTTISNSAHAITLINYDSGGVGSTIAASTNGIHDAKSNGGYPPQQTNSAAAIQPSMINSKCTSCNGHPPEVDNAQVELTAPRRPCIWYEEEIDENFRVCLGLKRILHTGVSKFQEVALLDTLSFGKVLTLDNKMQSAEMDEWVYHECLVHPALLLHSSPKNVFIMGGGEGSTAREALRHHTIKSVVMCDIDEEVVKFCSAHLTMNREAFQSNQLELVINDARKELETRKGRFDIIIGDLADPVEGGPCYQLYSKGFYESILKPRLNSGGIFVTQAGPAGVLSHKEVFSSIFNTLRNVFPYVVAYSAHIPSFADTWGWVMASDQPFSEIANIEEIDSRIRQRMNSELRYLDGATLSASTVLNKTVRESLANEKHIYTEDSARFVYGHGRSTYSSGR